MDALLTVEPFGFFTLESLRAGWYLCWRQLVRILPVVVAAGAIGGAFIGGRMLDLGTLIMAIGFIAAAIWGAVLVPQLTSRWTTARYGYALSGPFGVWWGITWRIAVVALVAAVVFTPLDFLGLSLSTAFKGSALGGLGRLLMLLLGLGKFAVTLLATGWAMSKVAESQLSGMPMAPAAVPFAPAPVVSEPVAVATPVVAAPIAPAPVVVAPVAAPVTMSAPMPVAAVPSAASRADGKRQCPKCGLYETERGSVIGWYCTICGWRESRR